MLISVLASVSSTSCSDALTDDVDPVSRRLLLGTAELTPGSTQSLNLEDGSVVSFSLNSSRYYQPVPQDPRGCWAPCRAEDIENWLFWRELWVADFRLTIQNTSSQSFAVAEYSAQLLCVSASTAAGLFTTPGYQEGSDTQAGVIELGAGEQRTIPLSCPTERWDPANAWTKDVYVAVTLTDESNAPWGDGNRSEDPLDPWR